MPRNPLGTPPVRALIDQLQQRGVDATPRHIESLASRQRNLAPAVRTPESVTADVVTHYQHVVAVATQRREWQHVVIAAAVRGAPLFSDETLRTAAWMYVTDGYNPVQESGPEQPRAIDEAIRERLRAWMLELTPGDMADRMFRDTQNRHGDKTSEQRSIRAYMRANENTDPRELVRQNRLDSITTIVEAIYRGDSIELTGQPIEINGVPIDVSSELISWKKIFDSAAAAPMQDVLSAARVFYGLLSAINLELGPIKLELQAFMLGLYHYDNIAAVNGACDLTESLTGSRRVTP